MISDSKHENIVKGPFQSVDKTTSFRIGVTFHTPRDDITVSIANLTVDDDLTGVDSF